ncbi:hypothetical protein [Actinophytocola sp.]|uniref:hypothetical protein n=1 Tax=Actinophytocola sp. TaxID=1872138 RepID=UPI002D4F74DA|nr:hypothetical protein [Actinophytocola sp.]HYQ63556.1 hypothetical protein [Actinophytocola sp.]
MRITYHGPHDGVELAALHDVVVRRGQTIEVDDALGASLVEQSTWDTSRGEILGWLNHVEDLDARKDWARRLLTAERNGSQREDVLEALEVWLQAQQVADTPPDGDDPPDGGGDQTPSVTPSVPDEKPAETPPAGSAGAGGDNTANGDQPARTTRKGAK